MVLLIDPFYNEGWVPPNWSLGRIETELLQNGIDVRVIDFVEPSCEIKEYEYFQKKENEFIQKVLKEILNRKIKIVYITSSYGNPLRLLPVFPRILRIAREIKLMDSQIKVIVGGANVTYASQVLNVSFEEYLRKKYIDFFVIGNEEKSLWLIKKLLKLKSTVKSDNHHSPEILWKSWNFQKYPPYLSLFTAKGCPYRCQFCFEPLAFDTKYTRYCIISVIKNIKTLITLRGINRFAIEDSTFLSNPELELFCDLILREKINIKWMAYARVDEVIRKRNLLPKMKKTGCSSLLIGIETPKEEILKKQNKLITSDLSRKAVELLKVNNIKIQGCFILIFPEDSLRDLEMTIDFAYSLKLDYYRWHIFQPNFSSQKIQKILKSKISPSDYLKVQLNVPDHCLPKVIERNPLIGLFDEHCLIRALPYLTSTKKILSKVGYSHLLFKEAFKLIKEKLYKRQKSFNEEKYYSVLLDQL